MLSDLAAPSQKSAQMLDQLRERFRVEQIPAGIAAFQWSENGLHDVVMNLCRVMNAGELSEGSKLLVGLAVASARSCPSMADFLASAAIAAGRSREEAADAISLATVQSTFNAYYRFRHQLPPEEEKLFGEFRAPFSANAMIRCRLSAAERKLICIAVSSANDCHACVTSHVLEARKAGVPDSAIEECVRVLAVVTAACGIADTMDARAQMHQRSPSPVAAN